MKKGSNRGANSGSNVALRAAASTFSSRTIWNPTTADASQTVPANPAAPALHRSKNPLSRSVSSRLSPIIAVYGNWVENGRSPPLLAASCSGLHSSAGWLALIGLNRLTLAGIIGAVWLTLGDFRRTIGATGLQSSALAHTRWD